MITKDFLRLLLANKKKLMPLKDVQFIVVAKYDELSVVNLQPLLKEDGNFQAYFPDRLPKGRNYSREYFFNILNTLYPDYTANLIAHAQRQRFTADGPDKKEEGIAVSDEWWELLTKNPYISRKYTFTAHTLRMQGYHHPPAEGQRQAPSVEVQAQEVRDRWTTSELGQPAA